MSRMLKPSVEMAATCAEVSACIWSELNASQSSVERAAIVEVDNPAIWAVLRLEMMVDIVRSLGALSVAFPGPRG